MSIKEMVFKRRAGGAKAGFLVREPIETYRAKSKDYLTSHQLADFRRNPLLFRKKELGLVPEEDRPAFLVGRAAHTLVLEGREAFEKTYAVGGPVNPKTGEVYGERTKAYREWAEAQDRAVLTNDQAALVENMRASVAAHAKARELFADGVAEGVARATYGGHPCQVRLDWFNPSRGLVDLKTCDNLDWLEMDTKSYGYVHQLAFYRAILKLFLDEAVPVYIVAVEKREPFRTGVWILGQNVLAIAQKENEEALARLAKCRRADSWPTGYEDIRTFDYL